MKLPYSYLCVIVVKGLHLSGVDNIFVTMEITVVRFCMSFSSQKFLRLILRSHHLKMCGIWAVFGNGSVRDFSIQYESAFKVSHRGPDAFRIESISHLDNCCVAFHRLAIVDDLNGMQPMRIKPYPYVWLLYNGEIYNYKRIKSHFGFNYSTECDGESIIHLYMKGGIEFAASMLDGVFAFCLVDTFSEKVYLGRDTFGVKPLFKLMSEGFMAVCSEAKGLIQIQNQNRKSIYPFPPGFVDTYQLKKDGKVNLICSKEFHCIEAVPKWTELSPVTMIKGDIGQNIRRLLTEAVRKRLMSDRRIGCLLSGGVDSSLVAALVCQLSKDAGIKYPIQTFTIGMEGGTDINAARKVTTLIGSEHYEILFTPEEGIEVLEEVIYSLESYDVITVRGSIAMYLLSRFIKKHSDSVVLFSGEGSDEVSQGYSYFHKAPSAIVAEKESMRIMEELYLYDVLRADRVTAAHGLELRFPFLDHQYVSYYTSLEPSLKQPRDNIEKYLLRDAFQSEDLLPREILWRTKEGFSDGLTSNEKYWFQYLKDHVMTKVNDSQMQNAPKRFPLNTPKTKEEYYYRQVFEKFYKGNAHWIPNQWKMKWLPNCSDPSARCLEGFKENQ